MSPKPYECGVCYKNFDGGEQCPRILPCSHSLCSSCINNVIRNGFRECPFCRNAFRGSSCEDFMINRGLLDIVEVLSLTVDSETSQKKVTSLESLKMRARKKLQEDTLSACHAARTQFRVRNLERILLETELMGTLSDIDKSLEHMQKLRDFYKRKYEGMKTEELELADTEEIISMQEIKIRHYNEELASANSFSSVGAVLDKTKEINEDVLDLASKIINFSSIGDLRDSNMQKNLQSCKEIMPVILDMITTMENKGDNLHDTDKEYSNAVTSLTNKFRDFPLDDIKEMIPWVETVFNKGWIFSFCNHEGRRLCGAITKKSGNRIFLHCLKDNQSLPVNAKLLKHEDVLHLGSESTRKTFLEIGVIDDGESRSLGTVVISLEDSGSYPQNFYYLCSGEKGASYCGSLILEVRSKDDPMENIVMGDYEKNTGKGGRPMVSHVNWNEERKRMSREYQWQEGLVRYWYDWEGKTNSKFRILTRDSPDTTFTGIVLGRVEEGLDILRDAILQHAVTQKVGIIDCGVVLYINREETSNVKSNGAEIQTTH